jgi:hypothetical protein
MDKPRHPNVIRTWVPRPHAPVLGPPKAAPAPRPMPPGTTGALRPKPHTAPARPAPAEHS